MLFLGVEPGEVFAQRAGLGFFHFLVQFADARFDFARFLVVLGGRLAIAQKAASLGQVEQCPAKRKRRQRLIERQTAQTIRQQVPGHAVAIGNELLGQLGIQLVDELVALVGRLGGIGRQQPRLLQEVEDLFQPPAATPELTTLLTGLPTLDVLGFVLAAGDLALAAHAAVETTDASPTHPVRVSVLVHIDHGPTGRLDPQIEPQNVWFV